MSFHSSSRSVFSEERPESPTGQDIGDQIPAPSDSPDPALHSAGRSGSSRALKTSDQNGKKRSAGAAFKKMFSAKRIALMAIFTALSFVVSMLEFPIFPQAEFLKLDFGNVFIMLIGFLLGPVEGMIVLVIKELLYIPVGGTGGVGQLANIIVTSSFLLVPSISYKFHKGLKTVIPALFIGCVLASGMALLSNRFILIPAFGIADPTAYFKKVWMYILAFNLAKTTAISIVTILLYKRLSAFLKKMKI